MPAEKLTAADVARDLLVAFGRSQGWPEADLARIIDPAANNRVLASGAENSLRWSVLIDPTGFHFEVSRCGRECDGPIHVNSIEPDYTAVCAAAERWCSGPPQLDLFT